MDINNTAELIEIKNRTLAVEKELEDLIRLFTKRQKIDVERTNDYGKRSFHLIFYFDDLNIDAFNNVEKIKELYEEHTNLRKRQQTVERQYDGELAIKKQINRGLRYQ